MGKWRTNAFEFDDPLDSFPEAYWTHIHQQMQLVQLARYACTTGGTIMKDKEAFWMTKAEYQEKGIEAVLTKCF